MRAIFKLFSLTFLCNLVFSTPSLSQSECHVSGVPNLNYFGLTPSRSTSEYWIKVYFNIVRRDNETGGYNPARVSILKNILDESFNPHGIYFIYECDISYLDDSERVANGARILPEYWCEWENQSLHSDGIDIFILAGFTPQEYTKDFAGSASGIPGTFMVLAGDTGSDPYSVIEGTTIIHEMGHLFGMYHLYHGSTKNPLIWPTAQCCPFSESFVNCINFDDPIFNLDECAEMSTNGEECGDYIPDTKPSHRAIEAAITGCEWDPATDVENLEADKPWPAPLIVDPEENRYDPDLRNFMSTIAQKSCRNFFSPNQVTVMKNHLENHAVLEDVVSTTPPAIACECPATTIININSPSNFSSVVSANGLSPFGTSDIEFRIKYAMTVDINYSFANCIFIFSEDASLIISPAKRVTFTSSAFNACDEIWAGISVGQNARVAWSQSTIKNAEIAISALFGSDLYFQDNMIQNFTTGIKLAGNTLISRFSGNSLIGGITGVFAESSNLLLQLLSDDAFKPNKFRFLVNGIILKDLTADIWYNEFHHVHYPIRLTDCLSTRIIRNQIGFKRKGISVISSPRTDIILNKIGWVGENTGNAVEVWNSSHVHIAGDTISSTSIGIICNSHTSDIELNKITITGANPKNSGGIFQSGSQVGKITSNEITATNSLFGIEVNTSSSITIQDNDVFVSAPWLQSGAGIRLLGSSLCSINQNISKTTGSLGEAIAARNASNNTFSCNQATGLIGLSIGDHSQMQKISGNILEAGIDLIIRSELSPQIHHGNEFIQGKARTIGLGDDEIFRSRFLVNDSYPYHMPSDPIPGEGVWFFDQAGEPDTCIGSPGLDIIDIYEDEEAICDYWESLLEVKDTAPAWYRIRLIHLLQYYAMIDSISLPDCIGMDSIYTGTCGVDDLTAIYAGIQSLNEIPTAYQTSFEIYTENIIDIQDSLLGLSHVDSLQKDTLISILQSEIGNLRNLYDSVTIKRNLDLVQLQSDVFSITCLDSLTDTWKAILILALQYHEEGEVDSSDRSAVIGYSNLCAEAYGDLIYKARFLAATFDSLSYEENDLCLDTPPARPILNEQILATENYIQVFPNPSSGVITIRNQMAEPLHLQLLDIHGHNIWQGFTDQPTSGFELNLIPGVYVLRILRSDSGKEEFTKLVIRK
jgi:hypothetical protein